MIPFSGPAKPATTADYTQAARILGTSLPVVQAVSIVETGGLGGYLSDGSGRPRILFEALCFSRATNGAFDATHPTVSSPIWNPKLYRGGAAEYLRLDEALALDRAAALGAASWGLFQILGSNFRAAGYASLEAYVADMAVSESNQIIAFARFILNSGMAMALQDHDWDTFSRHYNGSSYRANGYPAKLAAAYLRAIGSAPKPVEPAQSPVLLIGSTGPAVKALQVSLALRTGMDIAADGVFGPGTQIALRRFQLANHLTPDGIAGKGVMAALNPPTPGV